MNRMENWRNFLARVTDNWQLKLLALALSLLLWFYLRQHPFQ